MEIKSEQDFPSVFQREPEPIQQNVLTSHLEIFQYQASRCGNSAFKYVSFFRLDNSSKP